ncbi:hypothetical protein [Salinibacter grassmerensis]|uniref:hypothetical protein n=1 Tax=Salinibacter grassmerensis TaxID=3040353 RepID=UPI0021E75FFA|nr:hypothetical protein [Salinibacter grassmerensis]
MTITLEARWFGPAPLPDALHKWFAALGPVETFTQTDLYLPAEDPALNLKMRDGQLQIKRRLAGPLSTAFSDAASGRCEQWGKWTLDLADSASHLWDDDPTDLWVPVKKTRRQLSFAPGEQSALTERLPTTPAATLEAELTTVEADEETAWTFCLEAEGPVAGLVDTLTAAGAVVLDETLPVSLAPDQSFGYVRWLQQRPTVTTRPASSVQIPRN